jgi:hypothetical protein
LRTVLFIVALLVGTGVARVASATPCFAGPKDDPFPICFDPGNRLVLQLGYGGVGGGLALRHYVATDDPGITWRLEHRISEAAWDGKAWRGAVYRGRIARHARDGHIVLPTSPPKKVFLPFDIGGEADFGAFVIRPGDPHVDFGVVRSALLFELSRSDDFSRRLVFGIAGRWDVLANVEHYTIDVPEHFVAPFSMGVAGLHLESADGLTVFDVSVEAGTRWSSANDWGGLLVASAGLERVMVALDDHPLSLYCQTGWEDPGRGAWVTAGVRFALVGSRPTPP